MPAKIRPIPFSICFGIVQNWWEISPHQHHGDLITISNNGLKKIISKQWRSNIAMRPHHDEHKVNNDSHDLPEVVTRSHLSTQTTINPTSFSHTEARGRKVMTGRCAFKRFRPVRVLPTRAKILRIKRSTKQKKNPNPGDI